MNTLEFLQHVLPSEGYYCAIVINEGSAPQQAFFNTVEELATNCQHLDAGGNNTYYAYSSFNIRGNRKQTNVHSTKVVAIDVDCVDDEKHTYKNQKDGLAALLKFITDTGLPKPMIVSSGRGLHVYWVLDKALSPTEWTPLAMLMKQAAATQGFDIDPTITADSARVLRPTKTHNPKNGAEVNVLLTADLTDHRTLQNILQSYVPQGVTYVTPNVPTIINKPSALAAALEIKQDFPPSVPATLVEKCRQIKWAVANQDKVSEPLWYDLIGIAAFCVDPEGTAKAWSSQHPSYNEAETLRKVQQWKANATGPTTCDKIGTDRPKGCDGCEMRGKIGSPTRLGVTYVEATVAADAPDAIASETPLPYRFKRTKIYPKHTGAGYNVIKQTVDGTDVDICHFDIYPVGYGYDESLGYETVRYKWQRQHVGWQDLVFRQAHLNMGSNEFANTIADQGIVLKGKKQIEGFQYMLRAYMDELRNIKTMTNIHGSMGWKDDFTQFVIGDRLYKREVNGSVTVEDISLTSASGHIGHSMYGHKGTLDAWRDGATMLETANMPWHIFGLNQGFAAPLWAFTGLKGVTISLCGETGGGKSLIQLWQQSIWGDPEKLHFAAKFTHNALFNRLGVYCHLPMTIDEATLMEDVGEFCFVVTQGRDKARLNRVAQEREAKEWATSVTVSTNISFISKMTATGHETDAQMARLLEVNIPPHRIFAKSSTGGRKVHRHIMTNFGVPGDVYAKALLSLGKEGIMMRIAAATAAFGEIYDCKFTGAERYWEQNLILQHVGCQIAAEAGIITYDYMLGISWAVEQLGALRHAVEDNKTDGFKLINEYLNEVAADALTVMHTVSMPSTIDANRVPRGEVKARFDVYRASMSDKFDHGTVMLVRKQFKQWVSSRGYDYNTLCKEVASGGADATPSGKRFVISRNTSLKIGQQYVLGVNLNNEWMRGYLDEIQHNVEDVTLGQVVEVK